MAGQGGKVAALEKSKGLSESRIKSSNKAQKKLDRVHTPVQPLNAGNLRSQMADLSMGGKRVTVKQGFGGEADITSTVPGDRFPIAAYHPGHWLHPDGRDTNMQIRRELLEEGKDIGGAGATKFGVAAMDESVIEYLKDKKDQEAALREVALSEFLIDPTDPKTQEHAYTLYPELREVPDKYYHTQLAVQEALRTILRDGQIRGREDHLLIMKVCGPDFKLPTYPAWDPEGILTGQSDILETTNQRYNLGMFNPRNWGAFTVNGVSQNADGKALGATSTEVSKQIFMKMTILKRCYPGLRKQGDANVVEFMKQFLWKQSPITEKPITQGVWTDWFNKEGDAKTKGPFWKDGAPRASLSAMPAYA